MSLGIDKDSVSYEIMIKAAQAFVQLEQLTRAATDFGQRIQMAKHAVQDFSKSTGVNMTQSANMFKRLDEQVSASGQGGVIFGQKHQEGWANASAAASKGSSSIVNSINLMRVALGTFTAMLIFSVVNAFKTMVQGAMKGLVEIEAAMFNIVNAEKRLSEQGVEISVQGLQQLIEDLKELNPMLSEFQATELISTLATKVAPSFGFGTAEIERMAKSVAVLAVRNQALGKSFEEVEQQFITGLLSGKVTQGINQLGTKLTDQIVKEEAIALGLVQTADAYDALNAKAQERINILSIMAILERETAEEAKNLPAFLQTASGLIGTAKAEFQDILTLVGQKYAPVIKEVFRGIISIFERIRQSLEENEETWETSITLLTMFVKFITIAAHAVISLAEAFGTLSRKILEALGALPILGNAIQKLFPDSEYADTPTGASPFDPASAEASGEKYTEAIKKSEEDVQDAMQDARDKRLDIERDYQRKLQDIATDTNNKMADLATDIARKREDALRDYTQKVEDIERDTNQAIEEAQADARKKQEDAEAEHQQRLKELRQKFLFDLEDALHERDARQVLRLIRQYKFDKENLDERHKLQQEESKQNLQIKIQELQQEKQLKLDAARREYEEKLTDIAIGEKREKAEIALWKSRQLQDARLWHSRQLQENREYLQRRLRDIAAALAQELQINQQTAQSLVSMWGSAAGAMQQIGNVMVSPSGATQVVGSGAVTTWNGGDWGGYSPGNVANIPGFAEGGSLIATKPTKAIFGEDGPERVDFTPIGRTGKNVGRVFGGEGMGGMGGTIDVMLTLSPDLEARIVDTSLENVALHFEKLDRSK